ncbi:MAG TPA: 3-oxoacyl-ACP reductase [Clostridiales bacterium]|nr:3-oxoacyl-ACP reductase [Clostridiales bacterium]
MKTVVVTGGNGSIGAAIAKRMQKSGYNVVITYFSNKEAAEDLQKNFGFYAVKCDVKDEKEVKEAFKEVHKKFGKIYALINCAGIALKQKVITDVTKEEFENLFAVNVTGTFNCIKEALPDMISEKRGRIINVSSVWGVVGGSCEVAYSATKGAINSLTKALAREVGLSGVTVNAVAPGFIDTKMNAHLSEEDKKDFCDGLSVPRVGTPEEVAEAVAFLMENAYVTGQILSVDGGM